MLCLLVLFFVAFAPVSHAKHRICSWQDQGLLSPAHYGYIRFCLANLTRYNETQGGYFCWNSSEHVADYGFLGPQKLEFASPCGTGGYARDYWCESMQYWGVCVGQAGEEVNPDKIRCFYIGQDDDCEWPKTFDENSVPTQVDIWQKQG